MQKLDLNGNWQLTQAGKKGVLPATVPGCVHLDLLAAKKITDPYYRDHEHDVQWIGEAVWIYAREFTLPAALLDAARVILCCDGLDTLATIRVNGRLLAKTDNMFRLWEFDVKRFLCAGKNRIEVRFDSAPAYGRKKAAEPGIPAWSAGSWIHFLRKEACNFGWDWGPTLTTCGIWRSIRLEAFGQARLTDLRIEQDHHARGEVQLNVSALAEVIGHRRLYARLSVACDGQVLQQAEVPVRAGRAKGCLTLVRPRLWWPNNLGAQPLYEVRVELLDTDGGVIAATVRRIGLRTLRLVREKDRWGESFCFACNGVRFFAKGANWIPADAFAPRVTAADYRRLIQAAKDANMNMLRVWGGGVYEDDAFYDLCDELGICVWQDFMFACMTYPTHDDAFLDSVRAEAEDNVRRLRHHPCLALWCGNNELEQGNVASKPNPAWQMDWTSYGKLFDKLLPAVIRRLDGQRDYWPCSPHSSHGPRDNFNNPTCGDAHLWDVWHGRKPFEWYRTCEHRFNSEFGFQSFPEPKTVRTYTLPGDRNVTSHVMEHHQRSGIGNTVIMQYMLEWFRLPQGVANMLWLSQILQGMAIKYAVEHWRRNMPRGMGTLYWQLNDCWPVASWSSIDYFGRWKALHYLARKFYHPLLISGLEDTKGTVQVHVTSDRLKVTGGAMTWTLTDAAGATLARGSRRVRVPAQRNTRVETLDLSDPLRVYGKRNLLLWLDLTVGGKIVASNFVTFARPKHLELERPAIAARSKAVPDGFDVTLVTDKAALYVWLELPDSDLQLSDNFFHLRPGAPVTIHACPDRPLAVGAFRQKLRVRSLTDTYD